MANTHPHDPERFTDERLASLEPAGLVMDASGRLEDLHRRQSGRRRRRTRWTAVACSIAVVFVAVPGTRAFGARCVGACLTATSRVSELWRSDEPMAGKAPEVGSLIGSLAPDVVGNDAAGAPIHLADLRGRVVVLNFWATWCGPCKQEIPILNALEARFGAGNVTVIGVSLDEGGWTAVNPFAAERHINYRMALATDDVLTAYGGVPELPSTFIIDSNGRIVVKRVGVLTEGADDRAIEKLVRQIPQG